MSSGALARRVRQWAGECGFVGCRFARAESFSDGPYRAWLERGNPAGMRYLEQYISLRCDPRGVQPRAKTVISLAMSYAPSAAERADDSPDWISLYACGRDYHRVLRQRARRLCEWIAEAEDEFDYRVCVDTAPVLERHWAQVSGLGWIGRNSMLIVPGAGSYVLLAEILCNLNLPPDAPIVPERDCAACGRCVAACPTGALSDAECFRADKCLSYHTIENRADIPAAIAATMTCQLYGCDLCQRACPMNADVPAGDVELRQRGAMPSAEAVAAWTEADWDAFTRGRALRRAKLPQWKRNAHILLDNRNVGL